MKKLSEEEFIEKSKNIHKNKYDYSKVIYKNSSTKVIMICIEHGQFEQTPNNHLKGRGCEKCGKLNKKLNLNKFLKKANEKHGNSYDYSKVDIIDSKTRIEIICKKHGSFFQRPHSHYEYGCPKCSKFSNTQNFIQKSINLHGDRYDYSFVKYESNAQPVKIICGIHGDFLQKPLHHLNGCNCPKCSVDSFKLKKEDFIKNSMFIHGDMYDYSKVDINGKYKVEIVCKKHGSFFQTPTNHQQGRGCPTCNESKGEKNIRKFLDENSISYIREKKFDNCKFKKELKFDFYLPYHNICIEYDGEQHFNEIEHFGGKKTFIENEIRDNIKNDYCEKNKIDLIRIKFDEKIDERLNNIEFSHYKINDRN